MEKKKLRGRCYDCTHWINGFCENEKENKRTNRNKFPKKPETSCKHWEKDEKFR